MKFIKSIIALSLAFSINASHADTTFGWDIYAVDSSTNEPIQDANFKFFFTDPNADNRKFEGVCTTDTSGYCKVTATVTSSFFQSGNVGATFSVAAKGYSSAYKFSSKKIDSENLAITVKLAKLSSSGGISSAKSWLINEGPDIKMATSAEIISIVELFKSNKDGGAIERGKFETEDQYKARLEKSARTLIFGRVPTSDSSNCTTAYDHKTGTYSVQGCLIFSGQNDLDASIENGEPITLSNAYDKRTIKRSIVNSYAIQVASGFSWSTDIEIQPKEAELLESDLLAGMEVEGYTLKSSCDICESRNRSDSINKFSKNLSALTGKSSGYSESWKDEALKSGVFHEKWMHRVIPKKVVRYFIFRKSDSKVLFEMMAE